MSDDALGALELLKSDTLKKAMDQIEADILSLWRNSNYPDTDNREKLWMQLQAIGMVRHKLQTMIDHAKIEKANA